MQLSGVAAILVFTLSMGVLFQHCRGDSRITSGGILVRLDDEQGITVTFAPEPQRSQRDLQGIWFDLQGNASRYLRLPMSGTGQESLPVIQLTALTGAARGDTTTDGQSVAMSIVSLDQLASGELVRDTVDGGFLTPVDQGVQLSSQVTLRRHPRKSEPRFPEETVTLTFGTSKFEFTFPEGAARIAWEEIPNRPQSLQPGLPAGRSLLHMKKSGSESVFQVLGENDAPELRARMKAITSSPLATRAPELAKQILVQLLLQSSDAEGRPVSYFADALDLLEQEPHSPYLDRMKADLLARLSPEEDSSENTSDELADIDWARDLIARGQWGRAIEVLQAPELQQNTRTARLAQMYLGVALAESSMTLGGDAEAAFQSTLRGMESVSDSDAYRIHNNYGNFLFRNIQNGLNNHTLRTASGAAEPLFNLLRDWRRAADEYEQAVAIGQRVSPEAENAAQVSLARLYSLLADLMYVVNSTIPDAEKLPTLETAASDKSRTLAEAALVSPASDLATKAAAAETIAQLEHRRGQEAACRKYTRQALDAYLAMGSIVGAEGIFRLNGLSWLNEQPATPEDLKQARHHALAELSLSHQLAEHLREQYPGDSIGLSRAGFLARRAYVTDRMVELLLEEGEYSRALEVLETSKARALQDIFTAGNVRNSEEETASLPVSRLLADWPKETVCLEYFLGTNQAWVFCIDETGQVTAGRLRDERGQPLQTAELIGRVRRFLTGIEGSAGKMLRSTPPGQPFDGRWQEDLHRFWKELIPTEVAQQLADQKNVIIVPQHLLHYFPFAALVTEIDSAKRGAMESVMPKFWIESGINLTYAPSLSTWRALRSRKEQTARQVHGIGIASFTNANSLPGVKSDLANLQRRFGNLLQSVATGGEVNETKLRESMSQPGLVFLGTHGANRPDQPLASYLLCHADSQNDGYFMAGEIYQSRFQTCIAILSACYSGLADRSPLAGDDLFGIERALLHAGVRTVIDGVWDVYDATGTEIMDHVFEAMSQGIRTPDAVAQAQRRFIEDRRREGPGDPWIHPYFWAVYKVSGSDLTSLGPANAKQ